MNWINRIPIWAWFTFTFAFVYATWNPSGYSAYQFIFFSDQRLSVRFVVAVVVLIVYALYLNETYNSFNKLGALLFVAINGGMIWLAKDWGMINPLTPGFWQWVSPAIMAMFLTLGLQGGRIYRNLTGRMPVSIDQGHHDHSTVHHP